MAEFDDLLKPIKLGFKLAMCSFLDVYWKANVGTIFPILMLFLLNCGCFGFVYQNVRIGQNFEDVAESGGVWGTTFAALLKTIILLYNREAILSFLSDIKQEYFRSLKEHPEITNVFARHFLLVARTFYVILFIVAVMYTATSLFGSKEAKLLFLTEIPHFPSKGWPNFHIVYMLQFAAMWFGCFLMIGSELFTFFNIQFVCCRIEILTKMIKKWNANIESSRRNAVEARENQLLFQEIVEYRASIKRNMDAIKRIFSPILMATLLSTFIVICLSLVVITENLTMKKCCHIVYAILQTFMYSFVGNLLVEQNDKLVESVMLVDFYYLNLSERKAYMNLVQFTCSPIQLEAYIVIIDMNLFISVVKFSYSVFSLMKTKM